MLKKNKKGLLIVMSGPSGAGKGTIRDLLMKDKSLNLYFSISMTTRNKRPGEVNGRDYYYVTKEEFQKNVKKGNLLEWTEYVGNFYGTPKDKIVSMLKQGKNVLLEIEVKGASNVCLLMKECVSIFIAPPSLEELEARIRGRGTETEEAIKNRIKRASKEMELKDNYEYVVINDDVNRATEEVAKIIKSRM